MEGCFCRDYRHYGAMVQCLSLLHNFIQQSLNSGSAQVQTLFVACRLRLEIRRNPLMTNVAYHIETSELIYTANLYGGEYWS